MFGEGDGRLASPEALERRLPHWRDELGVGVIHWREIRSRLGGRFNAGRGSDHPAPWREGELPWNDYDAVPELAHAAGLEVYLYVCIFDEGRPLLPKKVRETSYHNPMHAHHVSWQSAFTHAHPEYLLLDRGGRTRHWGVPCLAYPEVRRHFRELFGGLIRGTNFDGLFVCLRSQSRPADFADQFGFNAPIRDHYLDRCGRDISAEDFDLGVWREICGGYLTEFLAELKAELSATGHRLAVGGPRGDILGPPLSNHRLAWRRWVERGIVDDLVINQNSSVCPSSWLKLWAMHRGYGYVRNYLDGRGMASLQDQLRDAYGPSFAGSATRLFVARQWEPRDEEEERRLLGIAEVDGLAFSTFRYDNPGPVTRDDYWA